MTRPRILIIALVALITAVAPAAAHAKTLRAPALASPAANAHVEGTPAITWGAVRGAVAYEYQVAADPAFGSVVLGTGFGQGSSRTANTAAALKSTLQDGDYYWRVRALNAADKAGRWSAARHFVKAWTTAPLLLDPADAATVQWPSIPLILHWTPVPYATRYVITLATDAALSSPVDRDDGTPADDPGHLLRTSDRAGRRPAVLLGDHPAGCRRAQRAAFAHRVVHLEVADRDPDPPDRPERESRRHGPAVLVGPDPRGRELRGRGQLHRELLAVRARVLHGQDDRHVAHADGRAAEQRRRERLRLLLAGPRVRRGRQCRAVEPHAQHRLQEGLRRPDTVDSQPQGHRQHGHGRGGQRGHGLADPPVGSGPRRVELRGAGRPVARRHVVRLDVEGRRRRHRLHGLDVHVDQRADPDTRADRLADGGLPAPRASVPRPRQGRPLLRRVLARSDRDGKGRDVISAFTQLAPAFVYDEILDYGAPELPLATWEGDYIAPQSGELTAATPLLTWWRIPGAQRYFVVIARDSAFTQVVDVAFTENPAYAPRLRTGPYVPLADETTSYYWVVMPATGDDGAGVTATIDEDAPRSFEKRSFPPQALAPAPAEIVGAQPAFHWTPVDGARRYRLQVSEDPTFAAESLIDDVTTAATGYTSSTTYPADAVVYWRVQALDENLQGQSWSCAAPAAGRCQPGAPPSSFQRVLPLPGVFSGNLPGGVGVPVLRWNPVLGAISYDVHVDWANGKTSDLTVASTAFTPTTFYGNGIWRWKVRANFPSGTTRSVSGGYLPAQEYVRRMDRTPSVRGTKSATRVVVSWDPDAAASQYRVEVSRSNGFNQVLDRADTKTTSFAPNLSRPGYAAGGTFHWRVASLDDGDNQGGWTTGVFTLPRALTAHVSGLPRRGRRGEVTVMVRDANHQAIRSARVRVTGRGLRSASRRTSRTGAAKFSLRPHRAGTLTFTITRKGYRSTAVTVGVS